MQAGAAPRFQGTMVLGRVAAQPAPPVSNTLPLPVVVPAQGGGTRIGGIGPSPGAEPPLPPSPSDVGVGGPASAAPLTVEPTSAMPAVPEIVPAPFGGPAPAPFGGSVPAPFGGSVPAPFGGSVPAPFGAPAPAPFGGPIRRPHPLVTVGRFALAASGVLLLGVGATLAVVDPSEVASGIVLALLGLAATVIGLVVVPRVA